MSRRDHYNRCPPCVTASLAAPALRRGYRSPAPRRSNSGGRSVGRTPADRATDRPPQVELSPATRPHYGPRPARDGAGGGRGSGGAPVGLRGSAGAGQQSITKPLPVETAPRTHGRPARPPTQAEPTSGSTVLKTTGPPNDGPGPVPEMLAGAIFPQTDKHR